MGSTSTQFKIRFRNHKSAMLTRKKNCEVAIHFNNTPHLITDFSFICIEAVSGDHSKQKIGSILLKREAFWYA